MSKTKSTVSTGTVDSASKVIAQPISSSRARDITPLQIRFCDAYLANGGNARGASRAIGAGSGYGVRALKCPAVKARLQSTLEAAGLGAAEVVKRVEELATDAKDERVRLLALQTLGKVWGLFPERRELRLDGPAPEPASRDELLADVRLRLGSTGPATKAEIARALPVDATVVAPADPPTPQPTSAETKLYIPLSRPATQSTSTSTSTDNSNNGAKAPKPAFIGADTFEKLRYTNPLELPASDRDLLRAAGFAWEQSRGQWEPVSKASKEPDANEISMSRRLDELRDRQREAKKPAACVACGHELGDPVLWKWVRDKEGSEEYCGPACRDMARDAEMGGECLALSDLLAESARLDRGKRMTAAEIEVTDQARRSGLTAYRARLQFLCEIRGVETGEVIA